jgi:DNA mismatch repair protein MutL
MPNTIHILLPELANKIAAGEVVQRPASAVKELVENAIDAQATRISVIVREAGKSLIQVIDNGAGMSEEDAVLAFQRHATSKISTSEDLENIRTLGFRGEALASIAAIAHVELKTRQESNDVATFVRLEGNEVKEQSRTALERGTSITVKNLFYNTPARRNFIKTNFTELKNITDVVTRMAIAHPEVEWLYVSDEETFLDLKGKSIEGRLSDIFGEKQAASLVRVEEKTEFLTIEGFIGKPEFARKTRVDQFVYLNKRYIFSKMINHAVFQAYEHLLIKGGYPFFILNFTIDPRHVDVNVHPSKMEVKFENESSIYRMVLAVVRRTLAANNLVPSVSFQDGTLASLDEKLRFDQQAWARFTSQQTLHSQNGTPVFTMRPDMADAATASGGQHNVLTLPELPKRGLQSDGPTPGEHGERSARPPASKEERDEFRSSTIGRSIWQIHNKYIVSQIASGVMIIDQHVAHERILYERILSNFLDAIPATQQLLFPQTVELSASDYSLVKELLPHLEKLGFALKVFGKNTVVIEGIPGDVRIGNEKRILQDVVDEFKNNEHAATIDVRDNLAKSYACKAAVKAGDKLNSDEMVSLIEHLFLTKMPYVCPHGRPIMIKIPLEELDRRFGRT